MKNRLKDTTLKSAKPDPKSKNKHYSHRLHDGDTLYAEVRYSGSIIFFYRYLYHSKDKRIDLGHYGDISLKEAREQRDAMRKRVLQGEDVGATRRLQKQDDKKAFANTFERLLDGYVAERMKLGKWKEETKQHRLNIIRRHILPAVGHIPVRDITTPQLLKLCQVVGMSAPKLVKTVRDLLVSILSFAVRSQIIITNPARELSEALEIPKDKPRPALTQPHQFKRLGEVLRLMENYHGASQVTAALTLLPYVFCRPGELVKMQWSDIDFEKREWRYIASKTYPNHTVPLADQVLKILRDLHAHSGHTPYVFVSPRSDDRHISENALAKAMQMQGINTQTEQCPHGFRATSRTILNEELHYPADVIEHQQARRVKDANGNAYNRTTKIKERVVMMQAWADWLDALKKQHSETIQAA